MYLENMMPGHNVDKMVDVYVQLKLRHLFFLIPDKI